MRKAVVFLSGLVFILLIGVGIAQAADKFAYVDLSRAFSEYSKTKTYDKTLSDKEKVYTDDRDKRVDEIKAFQDKINQLNDK